MKKILLLLLLFSLISPAKDTLKIKPENIQAVKINEQIKIDGKLSETVWEDVNYWCSSFTQKDPVEGKMPTEQTFVKVLYDHEAIYIGAKMLDSSPDSIVARLGRKDADMSSDLFGVFLDPYNDKRSGFYFGLSAAGTFFDGVLYNDSWDDDTWDGVWDGKTKINSTGWTAEFRIPFSQLRFHITEDNVWGINFRRDIARKNERDFLVYIPKNESGFVSHFSKLMGISGINPPGKIELLPYITTKAEYTKHSADDPFNSGSKYIPGLGADLKMGIGTNLTLNATINPDFGQVEIDPAVINLSDVETFFNEKRPFFVEGSTIFNFGQGGAKNYWGFNWSTPQFFYSRRIGRVPQGSTPDADFTDFPEASHIIGAAKLTGNIGQNLNIGIIQAVTSSEYAEMQTSGIRSETEVEPLTYYGVFRGQKEFNDGAQGLGFMSTLSARNFGNQNLRDEINSNSFTGGADGWTFLDEDKEWVFAGWFGASHIQGSKERITDIQRNSQHYFQRPDAGHINVDSNATSLTGYAGRIHINKQKGNFFVNTALGVVSPKFDINDVGFLGRADVVNIHLGAGYYWTEANDLFRYMEVGGAVFRNYDFGGIINWEGIFNFGYIEFLNYYGVNWNLAYNPETINNRLTRGGPLVLNEPGYQVNLDINSDNRKEWVASIGGFTYIQNSASSGEIHASLELKPSSNLSISISPFYNRNLEFTQWVDSHKDIYAVNTFGERYIFANLDQKTVGAGVRLNWTFSPTLSLQLYMQPLISSGDYFDYKELAAPRTYNFNQYTVENLRFDGEDYSIDPDGSGPAEEFQIENPDFNFKSLRGNAVLRWEYLPGSVFYFVWTQTRDDSESIGEFQLNRSVRRLFNVNPDNIFMIKFTYWINM